MRTCCARPSASPSWLRPLLPYEGATQALPGRKDTRATADGAAAARTPRRDPPGAMLVGSSVGGAGAGRSRRARGVPVEQGPERPASPFPTSSAPPSSTLRAGCAPPNCSSAPSPTSRMRPSRSTRSCPKTRAPTPRRDKNDKVDVVVNGTGGQVTIPSVVGQAVAAATWQLQSLGLVVKTNQVDSGGASGT